MKVFSAPLRSTVDSVAAIQADSHGMRMDLADGSHFSVDVLEASLVRVRHRPKEGYREPRTWAIAPVAYQDPSGTHVADVPWQGRPRDDTSGFTRPSATVVRGPSGVSLATSTLTVTLRPQTLTLRWCNAQGTEFARDRDTSAYFNSPRTGATRHYLQRHRGERYYGLGDKTGPLDLHGRRLRTLALDSLGYDPQRGDPLYKHWPFVLSRSTNGQWWGTYYDTLAACTFDLGQEHDNYHELFRYVEIDDGDLDYYLMVGASPSDVIAQFVRLIGGTHLPPRWSLGFAQTAMGLADAPDAQAQLQGFMDRIAQEGIPCSSFHYGSGYSSRGKRRYVFTWNNSKFPDPKALNQRFHAAGMRLVANIKPCLLDDHPAYSQVRAQGGFITDQHAGLPVTEQFWDGEGSHLDFTRPEVVAWWQAQLQQQVLDYGIDAGWNDNNEYAVMDDAATSHGFGQPIPIHRSRPLHGLLMTRATFEAQAQSVDPGDNFTVTRGGGPGIQRYAQTWSGDNTTSWQTLRWNIRTGLQMSLSGMFNVGHDVGGFAGPSPDAELFVRWVQATCLNPRMVMNSWKTDGTNNVPWLHPEVTPLVAAAIRLRYQLLPTLWSLFEQAHQQHQPILRPTFFNFPDDSLCYEDSDDFMVGDSLLVAPVVEQGAIARCVYLPTGPSAWFDFYTGQRLAPGQSHILEAPLGVLPLFAKAGARIAMSRSDEAVPRVDDAVNEVREFGT